MQRCMTSSLTKKTCPVLTLLTHLPTESLGTGTRPAVILHGAGAAVPARTAPTEVNCNGEKFIFKTMLYVIIIIVIIIMIVG